MRDASRARNAGQEGRLTVVLVRAPGNCREALELSCDPAAHLGPFGILQRMEDSREADPGFVGIAIGFEAAAEIAQRSEQVFVPSNQDGKLPSGGFAQRPVSPYSPYVLWLYQVGSRRGGGVSGSCHRVPGHWGGWPRSSLRLSDSGRG